MWEERWVKERSTRKEEDGETLYKFVGTSESTETRDRM